jgi:aminoglycoside 6-adenylyltransferase
MASSDDTLDRVLAWARGNELIRAVILEGSRANPRSKIDAFSDYDIAFVVPDVAPFHGNDAWARWYGEPLISWGDRHTPGGIENTMRLVIYEDGKRIDYCFWPPDALRMIKERGWLPPILDTGYRVLLDKDGVTEGLPPATGNPHVPRKPDEATFLEYVDDFWIDAAYVAKNLCRDHLLPAKHALNSMIVQSHLRRLLDWLSAIDTGWTEPAGIFGRGLKPKTPERYWLQVEALFVGADHASNWKALFEAFDLHRALAAEVAQALGFTYPGERDAAVRAYLDSLQKRDPLARP